jgi:hypothetical protein
MITRPSAMSATSRFRSNSTNLTRFFAMLGYRAPVWEARLTASTRRCNAGDVIPVARCPPRMGEEPSLDLVTRRVSRPQIRSPPWPSGEPDGQRKGSISGSGTPLGVQSLQGGAGQVIYLRSW